MKKPKPYNNGNWTEARMRSFIMSALRGARWPEKFNAVARAYHSDGINPQTGKKCKLHQCEQCSQLFPKGQMQADHTEPVVPVDGKWGDTTEFLGYNWNELLQRLYIPAEQFGVICKGCHKEKSAEERKQRAEHKKNDENLYRK